MCCDALGLECSLLRGEFNRYGRGGAHAWNVVRIYNEAKVADVMNKPGTFLEDTSDEVRIDNSDGLIAAEEFRWDR